MKYRLQEVRENFSKKVKTLNLKLFFENKKGFVWVNFIPSGPDRLVQNGDFLTSLSHFHEDPVFDDPIDIIYEDDDSVSNYPGKLLQI